MKIDIKKELRKLRRIRSIYYLAQFYALKHKIPKYKLVENNIKLAEMHDISNGKCFIIGNGPSLTVDDLSKVKNCYTFASNGIYKIFDKTDWRPTYYFVQDSIAVREVFNFHQNIIDEVKFMFVSMNFYNSFPEIVLNSEKLRIMYIRFKPPFNDRYCFSNDITKEVFEGLSVTYSMIQTAVYMGFKTIYLLGMDHSFSLEVDRDGKILKQTISQDNHFYSDHNTKENGHPTKIGEITKAYQSASDYCNKNGIQIYNATRGGKLEVFKRVDFDNLLL